jgi:hypothetical protein
MGWRSLSIMNSRSRTNRWRRFTAAVILNSLLERADPAGAASVLLCSADFDRAPHRLWCNRQLWLRASSTNRGIECVTFSV